ncbi:phosphotransferase family protein [Paenibacillus sp. OAS669]|uniref:phosphotransferase family protein n=1 Tax=Paenibacillus sp. OAS669 TaxID=2663821 RepID=UPI00178B2EC2|nr:aminoglycoside phosphotransferase family protein [Paenibacillus sp. OAS669]MBE1443109.1 aminoglycoside phosphotransferase (APT) family kinase protein [Paenibacillus sp. OAS669]
MNSCILRAIEAFGLSAHEIRPVSDSFSSEVVQIVLQQGGSVYIKIPYNRTKLYREYSMLNRLYEYRLPVPRVLDIWEGDEQTNGALLLMAIEGSPLQNTDDVNLAYSIGALHAELHSVPMPGYGYDGQDGFRYIEQQDWKSYIRRQFDSFKAPCRELLPQGLYDACLSHFDSVFTKLPAPDGPCVIHMDFRPGNLLVNESRLVGVIDFESSRGGSSECDFTKMDRYLWQDRPSMKHAYLLGYTSIRSILDLDLVLPFYSFYDSFSSVGWCKQRGLEKNRRFYEESVAVLCHETGWKGKE